jgi:hypothetical protein
MATVIGPRFSVVGIEPASVRAAAPEARTAYWGHVLKLVLAAKDRELAAGLDRYGKPMTPLAASTIRGRRSAMGPADPGAPPLTPAHELSRTRSLLTGRATANGVTCWWLLDRRTADSWGVILAHHRAGSARLPRRDVIGLSPASRASVAADAAKWWARREATMTLGGDHYDLSSGTRAGIERGIANGSFTGFKMRAETKRELRELGIVRKADGRYDFSGSFGPRKPPPAASPGPAPEPKPKPTPATVPAAPKPAKPARRKPNGPAVGRRLIGVAGLPGPMEAEAGAAIKAVDSVHGDGRLPILPIQEREPTDDDGGALGVFYRRGDAAWKITLNPDGGRKRSTLVHEIGHFVEWSGIPLDEKHTIRRPKKGAVRDFARDPLTADWYKAVRASDASKANRAAARLKTVDVTTPGGTTYRHTVDKKYMRYLNSGVEEFARSYTQYVALRSKDQALKDEVHDLIDRGDRTYYRTQWDYRDFEPIARAFDALFLALGWLI